MKRDAGVGLDVKRGSVPAGALLLALAAAVLTPLPAPAQLFGDNEARRAILDLRQRYQTLTDEQARTRSSLLELQSQIESLRSEFGTGIVMVSHSMDDVAMYADRIAVLDKGALYMIDTPQKVFSHSTELLEMGLNLPQATQLVRALRDRGIAIERDYFRMDELAQDLIGRWKHDR